MNIQPISLSNVLKFKANFFRSNPENFPDKSSECFFDDFELKDDNFDEIIRVKGIIAQSKKDIEKFQAKLNNSQNKNKTDSYELYRRISVANKLCANYEKYLQMLIDNPEFSPLFNPEYSKHEKECVLEENGIYSVKKLAEMLDIEPTAVVTEWLKNGVFDSTFEVSDETTGRYINTATPKASALIEDFKARRKDFLTFSELRYKYNIQNEIATKYVYDGKLKLFGIDLNNYKKKLPQANMVMVDIADKTNSKTLKRHSKMYPKRSDYTKSLSVPAMRLSRLGFGDIETIRELIRQGKLNGKISKYKTNESEKYLTEVETLSPKNIRALTILRNRNSNLVEVKNLAQRLNISPKDIRKLLIEGKMEIIPEYILESDFKEVYIDITNPKNAKAIEEIQKQNDNV